METSNLDQKRQAVMDAQKTLKEAQENASKLLKELQSECKHETVIGLEYKPGNYIADARGERKICLYCGFEEEAKGLFHFKILLNEPIKKFSRFQDEDFFKFRYWLQELETKQI